MTDNYSFGEWLLGVLHKRDMNQSELARRANVSRSAISGVITGRRRPGRDLLGALASALSIPAEDLFRAAGVLNGQEKPIGFAEWIGTYLSADEETQTELLDFARFWAERKKKGNV